MMNAVYVDERDENLRFVWYDEEEHFDVETDTKGWHPGLAEDVRDGLATGRYEVRLVVAERRCPHCGEYRRVDSLGQVIVPAGDAGARQVYQHDLLASP